MEAVRPEKIVKGLCAAGFPAYYVGGCVRDCSGGLSMTGMSRPPPFRRRSWRSLSTASRLVSATGR